MAKVMANAALPVLIIFALLAPAWTISDGDVTECLPDDAGIVERSLLQKRQERQPISQGSEGPHWSLSFVKPATGTDDAGVGSSNFASILDQFAERLVMSNPWKCKFLPTGPDFRWASCDKTMLEAGLYPPDAPKKMGGGLQRLDAVRALLPIGSLPCCATAPFCAAPDCAANAPQGVEPTKCTKTPADLNYAYMVHPDVWPAYRLMGGSMDLDVQKHWDVIGRLQVLQPALPPFDLVIDLGANFGIVTEKLVMRRFAKDYILVEAVPNLRQIFNSRFGNATWRDQFVSEQPASWEAADPFQPHFEFMNFAMSDKAGGFLDTCSFNWGNKTPTANCTAPMASVDSIIPGKLSPEFVDRFKNAQSAYLKVDVEGMDQMVVNGMKNLLAEKRGDDYLVNFMMLEFCSPCMEAVRKQSFNTEGSYDLKTFAATLEAQGFEAFLVGPRYIPLTHGSWDDAFVDFSKNPQNQGCNATQYPKFKELLPELFMFGGECAHGPPTRTTFTADIFALRSGSPRAEEIKVALGACVESHDFDPKDAQYDLTSLSASK